jgi:mRNA interferase MazF
MAQEPSRGEVWLADFDPTRGHEQRGLRPLLVISTNTFNHGRADLIIVLPLTTSQRPYPYRVKIAPPEGGLRATSYALCDSVRSIAKERLVERWGMVAPQTLEQAADYLRILMEL